MTPGQIQQTIFFDIFLTFSNFSETLPNPSENVRKHSPNTSQHDQKTSKKLPRHDQKVTCTSRESNPVPWDPESEDQPTRLFRHQKMSSLRNLYASKIHNLWPHARRGFFRSKNSVSYILRMPNLDVRVLKTQKHLVFKSRASGAGARRGFFRAQNSDFLFLNT